MESREDFFRRLLQTYSGALQRLASCYEENAALREDLLQEIYLALWQAIPRFRGDASERTWLYRIAHNTAISASLSRGRRSKQEHPMPEHFDPPSAAEPADRRMLAEEERRSLFASIRMLPVEDRQIVTLHLDGLSYAEIENVTELSQTAIATRLSRLRKKLAESIGTVEKRK
jgi:RNA polymerase sigma-70 factor (ECF subfamily)